MFSYPRLSWAAYHECRKGGNLLARLHNVKVNACHLVHSIIKLGKLVYTHFVSVIVVIRFYIVYIVYIFQDQESVLIHFKSFTYSKIVNSPN